MAYFEINNTVGSGAIATTGGAYTYDYWLDVTLLEQTSTGSKIRVKTWLRAGYARFESYWCTDSITINGYHQTTFNQYYSLPAKNTWYEIQTYETFIEHTGDTNITVTTSFSGPSSGSYRPGSATATISGTLPAIWTPNGNDLSIDIPSSDFTNWEGEAVDITWTGPTLGINNYVVLYHARISKDGSTWKTLSSGLGTSYSLKESDFSRLGLEQQDSYYLQIEAIPAYGNSTKSDSQTLNWNWAPVNPRFNPESITWNIDEVESPEYIIQADNPNSNQTDAIFSQASAASAPIVGNEPPQMNRGKNKLTYADLPKVSNAILDVTGSFYLYGTSIKTVQNHERYSTLVSTPLTLTSTKGYHFNNKPSVNDLEITVPHTYIGSARLKNTIETIVLSSYLNDTMIATKEVTRTYGADEVITAINFFDLLNIDLTADNEYTFSVKCIEGGREIEYSDLVFSYTAPVVDVNMYAEYGSSPRFLAYQKNPFATTMQFPVTIHQSTILNTTITVYMKAYANRQQDGQAIIDPFAGNSYAPAIGPPYSTMQSYTLDDKALYFDFSYYYVVKYDNYSSTTKEQPVYWAGTNIQTVNRYVGSTISSELDMQSLKPNFFDGDINSLTWKDKVKVPDSKTFKLIDAIPVINDGETEITLTSLTVGEVLSTTNVIEHNDYIYEKQTNIKYSSINEKSQYVVIGEDNLAFGVPVAIDYFTKLNQNKTELKPNKMYTLHYEIHYGELYYNNSESDAGDGNIVELLTINTQDMNVNIYAVPTLKDTATLSRRSERYE